MMNSNRNKTNDDEIIDILGAETDNTGTPIWWGECVICGERTHYKVSDVKDREMIAGETYLFTHPACANKWKAEDKLKEVLK